MTREQAVAEAARMQHMRPDLTWKALPRGSEWVVASIGLPPAVRRGAGTAVKPPPPPHGPVQSELQRVATQYGAGV
jgi:hypothetical protein